MLERLGESDRKALGAVGGRGIQWIVDVVDWKTFYWFVVRAAIDRKRCGAG
jgi:hypothetical protein